MSRRHSAEKRKVLPDIKFGDVTLTKFMNVLMYDGKSRLLKIVYGALDKCEAHEQPGTSVPRCAGKRSSTG